MWFVNHEKASVIENNGTVYNFNDIELGTLWSGCDLYFGFTPSHIYYSRELIGVNNFDGYSSSSILNDLEVMYLTSDLDTLFIVRNGDLFTYHPSLGTNNTGLGGTEWVSRNGIKYVDGGPVVYVIGIGNVVSLSTDSDYLFSPDNMFCFSRYTDTLYVAQETGISLAYKENVFDTITPNNTSNMPSANVLDIEFDMNDSLWAVFGDATGDPFALAKLEGSVWTNIYDSTNSPIDFSDFLGLEFDTLNNIWVAQGLWLHTLDTVTTPDWLGLDYISDPSELLTIHPNPTSNGFVTIEYDGEINAMSVMDYLGRIIYSNLELGNSIIDLSELRTGSYIIQFETAKGMIKKTIIIN